MVPTTETAILVKAALPVFVRVTDCDPLVVETPWLPKPKLVGLRLAREAVPAPVRVKD